MNTADTQFDTQLIEDYLHTTEIQVSLPEKGIRSSLAPYVNHGGQSETLVITEDETGGTSIYQVVREPKSDSGWNYYGLGAQANQMAVIDASHVWIYGTDNNFWIYKNGKWDKNIYGHSFEVYATRALEPTRPNAFSPKMGASLDGHVWCIDKDHQLWSCDPNAEDGSWGRPKIGSNLDHLQAPVGTSDHCYALVTSNKIHVCTPDDPFGGTELNLAGKLASMIAMGSDGVLWALLYAPDELQDTATLYQYDAENATWLGQGDTPLDLISVADSNTIFGITGTTRVTDNSGKGYQLELCQFNLSTQAWTTISSEAKVGIYFDGKMILENSFGLVAVPGTSSFWYFDTLIKTWKSTATAGGKWGAVVMPTGMQGPVLVNNPDNFTGNVKEIAVGVDKRVPGVSRCFFTAGEQLYYSTYLEGQAWSYPTIISADNLTNLSLTNQMDDGSLILYAASESEGAQPGVKEGKLFTAVQKSPALSTAWTVNHGEASRILIQASDNDAPLSIALTAKNATDWCLYANYQSVLYIGFGTAAAPPDTMSLAMGNNGPSHLKATEIVQIPVGHAETDHFVVAVDETQNVQLVWDLQNINNVKVTANFTPLSGDTIALNRVNYCCGVLDGDNLFRLYATDQNDRLWVLRQLNETPSDGLPFTLTHWHPLGDSCLYLANGPGLNATTEVFTLDEDRFLQSVRQNATSGVWESVPIHKPSTAAADPKYVSQYVSELTLTQKGTSVPMPGQAVTVGAMESFSFWHKGQQHHIGPGDDVTLMTDRHGKISVNTLAFGLHSPGLTFSAANVFDEVSIYPSEHLHERLAKVDKASLQNAKKYTKGFQAPPESLVPPQASNLNSATQLIQGTYSLKQQHNIGYNQVSSATTSGEVVSPKAMQAMWASKLVDVQVKPHPSLSAAAVSGWDKFWNSVAHFAQDVWHAVKKGILQLTHAVVDAAKQVIQLAVELEGVGQAVMKFIVKTIDDVAHAVQTAFKWIEVEVEDAINWLKSVFDWQDILATKDVVKFFINYAFDFITEGIDPKADNSLQNIIDAEYEKLKALILDTSETGIFTQAQTQMGTVSYNEFMSKHYAANSTISSSSSVLEPDKVHTQSGANQVKSNYVRNKLSDYCNKGGKLPKMQFATQQSNSGAPELLQAFISAFDDNFSMKANSPFAHQVKELNTKLGKYFTHDESFLDLAMTAVIDIIKDLVLAFLEAIKNLLVDVMNLAYHGLDALKNAMNTTLNIPVISWIYRQISDQDLSVMDLIALVVSAPLTVIYKLIWGGAQVLPPVTKEAEYNGVPTVEDIISRFPQIQVQEGTLSFQPIIKAAATTVSAKTETTEDADSGLKMILGIFTLLNSFVSASFEVMNDIDVPDDEMPFEDLPDLFFDVGSIVCQFIDLGLTVPYEAMGDENRNAADNWLIATWAAGAVGPIVDIIFTSISNKDDEEEKGSNIREFAEAIVPCVGGVARLVMGVFAAIAYAEDNYEKVGAADSANGLIAPIPSVVGIMKLMPSPVTVVIMATTDLVCEVGAGACALAGAVSD